MVISEKGTVARMIKLSQNENAFGASPLALKAISDSYRSVYRYPDVTHDALNDRLARKFNVPLDHIVVAAGAVAVVDLAIKAFVGFDENIVTAEKTFVAYKKLAGINRRECKSAPLSGNTISLDNLKSLCDGKTRVLFIANPNNPTGTIFSHAELSKFMNAMPRRIVVVLDEAYAEYVTDSAYPDSLQLQKEFENLVILRTFSKIYGLAGLRIGYGIAHPDVIKSLHNSRTQFSVNRLGSAAALAALDDTKFVEECAHINERERTILYKELKRMGFNVTPSQGNFLMVEFAETGEMDKIFETLKDAGITVRPLGPFGVEKGLRISVGRPEENKKLISCLKGVGS